MRTNWIIACTIGEAAGIAAVAAIYAAIDRGIMVHAWVWILTAGGIEGLCLGGAQALVLRRLGVHPAPWIVATVLAAVAGYGLSILGGAGSNDAAADAEPPMFVLAGLGVLMGLAMGALMGAAQTISARGKVPLFRWIAANAFGWALAMPVIMLAATSAERVWRLGGVALLGAGAGAVAGLLVAIATSFALPTQVGDRNG